MMRVRGAVDDVAGLKGVPVPVVIPTTRPATGAPVARVGRGGGRWRRMAMRSVPAAIAAGLLLLAGSASAAVAADTCSNAVLRADNASTKLPDCRGYEMVTPPYKEGFNAFAAPGLFTDDGILRYQSVGSFAGNGRAVLLNAYNAERSAAGWATTSLAAPDSILDTGGAAAFGASADLRWALTVATRRALPGDTLGFWLRDPDGGFTRVGDATDPSGQPRFFVGWSSDLSHVVFSGLGGLYEFVGTGNGAAARAVSDDNHGQAAPGQICDTQISPDARVIIFMSGGCSGTGRQVWARVAGSATVAVSGSECTRSAGDPGGACNDASDAAYAGRSDDGSRVFFTTSQQLVNSDTDAGNDLYACDLPSGVPAPVGAANRCATLTEVSGTAADAQVENVVGVSADGSRVYFVAQGVLADNLGVDGLGPATATDVAEPHNLYVWERDGAHPTGVTRFVARLTGPTGNDVGRGQVTPDGRYLLLVTANQLVTTGPGADSDCGVPPDPGACAKDAYRYDAVTHAIVRVSTSVSGSGGNDSGPGSDVLLVAGAPSMTADGSTVIFDSAEALSADDTDGVTDVYSWRDDGQVSLISAGGGRSVGITASGRDIFFATDVPVLGVDGDANSDVYDARVGGGFPVARAVPCSGDGCQGQRSQAPPLAGPSAAVPDGSSGDAPSAFSLRAVSAAQRRVLAATGKVSLVVTANAPGTITARATATIGGRSVAVGSGKRTLTAPGRATVVLTLSKKARGRLAGRGRLSVKVSVSHSKVALDRSVTLKLVHARSKAKRSFRSVQVQRAVAGVGGGRS
jgi:hypothetical protein